MYIIIRVIYLQVYVLPTNRHVDSRRYKFVFHNISSHEWILPYDGHPNHCVNSR